MCCRQVSLILNCSYTTDTTNPNHQYHILLDTKPTALQDNLLFESFSAPSTSIRGPLILQGFNYRLPSLASLPIPFLIQGDLTLWGLTNFTSTAHLSAVQQVQGKLQVAHCPILRDLLGMRSIASVEGDLVIENNDGLYTLNGLDNLQASYNSSCSYCSRKYVLHF